MIPFIYQNFPGMFQIFSALGKSHFGASHLEKTFLKSKFLWVEKKWKVILKKNSNPLQKVYDIFYVWFFLVLFHLLGYIEIHKAITVVYLFISHSDVKLANS